MQRARKSRSDQASAERPRVPRLTGALVAVGCFLALSATALALPGAVSPPRQWTGTAHYTETRQSGNDKQQVVITARITLGHIAKKGHTKYEYISKRASITWGASGADQFRT